MKENEEIQANEKRNLENAGLKESFNQENLVNKKNRKNIKCSETVSPDRKRNIFSKWLT